LTISGLHALGAEQNGDYFLDYGFGELKVSSQVTANVLLSMLGFVDDAISDAFRNLRRVEALEHKIEEDGSQDRLCWLEQSLEGWLASREVSMNEVLVVENKV
jgi:hypothetical protein